VSVARSSGSRQTPRQWPFRIATKYSAKLQLAASMKRTDTASSSGEAKCAKLASCGESPPRLTVVNMCMSASMAVMPPAQYARKQAAEKVA
jgi:hypothetical protein